MASPPLPSFLSSPPSRKAHKLTRAAHARAASGAPTQAAAVYAVELNLLTHEMQEKALSANTLPVYSSRVA